MSEKTFNPDPNDQEWIDKFSENADREFEKLEENLGHTSDLIEDQMSYEETYKKLSLEYADIEDEKKVMFLSKLSDFIAENKMSNNIKIIAQVRAHQDILSDLMSERG